MSITRYSGNPKNGRTHKPKKGPKPKHAPAHKWTNEAQERTAPGGAQCIAVATKQLKYSTIRNARSRNASNVLNIEI